MVAVMEATKLRDLTRGLSEVARLSADPGDVDALLRSALDALSEAIPYDLAAVLELREQELVVRCARGPLANSAVVGHEVEIHPGSAIHGALESRRARVMGPEEHEAGEDPYHDVVELPDGHGCLVVPLVAADQALGVMTFDRARCQVYDTATVELASIYGQLVALALVAAQHAETLHREKRQLEEQNRILVEDRAEETASGQLAMSGSPAMRRAVELARQVAVTEASVLITGETGTGKEVLARAIHEWSGRSKKPFVKINCAALPESLIESELFGHVKGAFSGADKERPGRFLAADGGTLLLDEIGDMPLAAQAKLLRVLQEGTIEPVGSDRTVAVDVRVLAATHVELKGAILEGLFREDLYYRIGLFPIELPPLRARGDDVLRIADGFLTQHARRTGRGPWTLGRAAGQRLLAHAWPGNVRELVNALERATILLPRGEISEDQFPVETFAVSVPPSSPDRLTPVSGRAQVASLLGGTEWPTLEAFETEYLRSTLERTAGKIYGPEGAAELAGLKPTTLQSRLEKRGLKKRGGRKSDREQ